jgi:lysophospholipase L1-like esterase
MLEQFDTHFRRLLHRARAHADRVIVVRQPWFGGAYSPEEAAHMWHGGVGQAWRADVTTYYAFDVVSKLMTLVDAKAAAIADAMDIEQIDLMPVLDPGLVNYYDCFHATPAGAQVVATAVAATVVRAERLSTHITADLNESCVASRAS